MVVFTTADLVDRVTRLRTQNAPGSRTVVISTPSIEAGYPHLIAKLSSTMEAMFKYAPAFLSSPHCPEYWSPSYVMVNLAKTDFVCRAYEAAALPPTTTVAWIDFGYCNNDEVLGNARQWEYVFTPHKMHLFALHKPEEQRPIFDVVRTGQVYIVGGVMIGGLESWLYLRGRVFANLALLLKCGLVDDDQTLLLMSYFDAPEKFQLHFPLHSSGWRFARSVLRDFNDAWRPTVTTPSTAD